MTIFISDWGQSVIEWKNNIIDPAAVEFLKFQTHYFNLYKTAYSDGTPSAHIFFKRRESPCIIPCNEAEFNELKTNILK